METAQAIVNSNDGRWGWRMDEDDAIGRWDAMQGDERYLSLSLSVSLDAETIRLDVSLFKDILPLPSR
jgi:hypothetical protein